jgi:hypothetical protein
VAQISRLDDCAMNNMVYIATSIASICVSEVDITCICFVRGDEKCRYNG